MLAEEIRESPSDFIGLLHHKVLTSWSDEWAFGYYASVPEEGNTNIRDTPSAFYVLTVIPHLFLAGLYLLRALAALSAEDIFD